MTVYPAPQPQSPVSWLRRAWPFGVYLAVAVLITWPLVTQLGTHFAGYSNGDAHEMTRHIWWMKHALQTGQPLFYQPLLGYPDGIEGVILWSNPLQFFPAWLLAFVLPLPAAYNLSALLNLALNGCAAYILLRELSGGRLPALLGGLAFMAAPAIQGHLAGGHGGLLVQWPLPLLAWALVRLRAAPPSGALITRRGLWVAVFWVLLPLGHTLQLIYAGLPLAGLFAAVLLAERRWRTLAQLAAALALGSAALLVFLLPVAGATFGTRAYTDEGGAVAYSIDLLGVVSPSFNHPLFGNWTFTHRVLGTNIVEGSSYVGLAAAMLGVLAVWRHRAARFWLLLAALAWVLALGPLLKVQDTPLTFQVDGYTSQVLMPWALLENLPVFNLARTPGRFNFLLALAVAVLAGYGLEVLLRHVARRFVVPVVLVVAAWVLFEYQSFWPLPTYPAAVPEAVAALAERDDVRAVFDVPWWHVLAAKDALWLQTAHQRPLVAGHVTRRTPVDPAKLAMLDGTLDADILDAVGADVVIVHKAYASADVVRERLGAPFYEDDRLALFDVPAPDPPPAFAAVPAETPADVTDQMHSYAYAPFAGWAVLEGMLDAEGRDLHVLLDGTVIHRLPPGASFSLRLPLAAEGFYTVTLAVDPPCPPRYDRETLACWSARVSALTLADFGPARFLDPVRFERGVTLAGAMLIPDTRTLEVALWWQFGQPLAETDVRFIKVLDAGGEQVAGVDTPLGAQPAGGQWVENVRLDLPEDLPPGEYTVVAGWYTFPELARFRVLADTPGAAEGLASLGSFPVP